MTRPLPPLGWLRTFEAAARHAGFATAARELALTPAAVSQQIRALETHLGVELFERLPRGIRLTTTGRAYLPAVRRAIEDLGMATAGLFGAPARRAVTLRCPVSFAALCLAPRRAALREQHPALTLRLYASIWSDDLQDDRIDLEIRYGDGRWDGFEVARLTAPVSVPACPPGTAFGATPAAALDALMRRGVVQILGCEDLWSRLARAHGLDETRIRVVDCVDTSAIALELVAAGIGPALVSQELVRGHAEAGRIALPPGIELRHGQAHHLLLPRRSTPPAPHALVLRDWLLAAFADPAEAPGVPDPATA